MLSEVSNFVNTARADTFLLEASRGIIPASCRAPWSFDGERIEASKVALRAQWWAAGAPLLSQRNSPLVIYFLRQHLTSTASTVLELLLAVEVWQASSRSLERAEPLIERLAALEAARPSSPPTSTSMLSARARPRRRSCRRSTR